MQEKPLNTTMKPIAMFIVILLNLSHLHTDNSTRQYFRELKPRLTLQVYVADTRG